MLWMQFMAAHLVSGGQKKTALVGRFFPQAQLVAGLLSSRKLSTSTEFTSEKGTTQTMPDRRNGCLMSVK